MSRRPFLIFPHGPRRGTMRKRELLICGCPRQCPAWEMNALHALIKPQLKNTILHRSGGQKWTARDRKVIEAAHHELLNRLTLLDPAVADALPRLHFPRAGEFHLVGTYPPSHEAIALAQAAFFSTRLPGRWFVVGRLLVRDGKFFRRTGRFRLRIVAARSVHLPRPLRAVIGTQSPNRRV